MSRPAPNVPGHHFRYFTAREAQDAAKSWRQLLEDEAKMLISLAAAMSTAELGVSLAKMIREDKVHAISCTGANLEEDIFNLVARNEYKMVPNYRDLSPEDEYELLNQGFNRVTDTCIPETVMRHIEDGFIQVCADSEKTGRRLLPAEVYFELFQQGVLEPHYQIPKEDSWMLAAWEKKIPVYAPGFEDSTLARFPFCCKPESEHPCSREKHVN